MDPPQQSGVPAAKGSTDYLETSLTLEDRNHRLCASTEDVQDGSFLTKEPRKSIKSLNGTPDFARRLRKSKTGKEHSMDCVNHSGVNATAYCQNCGKALCATCVRNTAGGQILCEPCAVSWQNLQQPFVAPPAGSPNPVAAAVLGLIPGVGAMYNGQFIKGLIHVVIFAVLISITTHYGIFGIFIPAWILYQAFEAYHTAVARRDGHPLPDPLGLNEVGNWLNVSHDRRIRASPRRGL